MSKRNKILLVFLILLGLATVASALVYYFVATNGSSAARRGENIDNIVSKASSLATTKSFDESIKYYDQQINSTTDKFTKSFLLSAEAAAYLNNGNTDKALSLAQQAEKLDLTANIAQMIAQIYTAKADTANAIKYYNKAISLVDDKDPTATDDKRYYQLKIDELNGKVQP